METKLIIKKEVVSKEEAMAFAEKYNMYFETNLNWL